MRPPMTSNRRVCIFGGTFNPIHWGHLVMAQQAYEGFGLDEVLWVPAGQPPHKALSGGATTEQRVEMVRLAIDGCPYFRLSQVDATRDGPSYAYQTLQILRREYPQTEWYWLLGEDAVQDLINWYRADDVIPCCHWLVAVRSGDAPLKAYLESLSTKYQTGFSLIEGPVFDLSSTLVRERLNQGRSIRFLVHPKVDQFIFEQELYRV